MVKIEEQKKIYQVVFVHHAIPDSSPGAAADLFHETGTENGAEWIREQHKQVDEQSNYPN